MKFTGDPPLCAEVPGVVLHLELGMARSLSETFSFHLLFLLTVLAGEL